MKFLVKITGPKGYSKQGQVEADNRNQAEAEMYKQLRQAGMKAGYKVKVLMTLNKDSALSVDDIKAKYGVTQQNDALNKEYLVSALKETNKEIKDLQRQLKEKMDYVKVLKERISRAK